MKMTAEELRLKKIDRWVKKFDKSPLRKILIGNKRNPEFAIAATLQKLVRVAEADDYGRVICLACGIDVPWQRANGGHYMSRQRFQTAIQPENINVICAQCNCWNSAETLPAYRANLVKKYSEEIVRELETRKPYKVFPLSTYELAVIKVDAKAEVDFHLRRIELTRFKMFEQSKRHD